MKLKKTAAFLVVLFLLSLPAYADAPLEKGLYVPADAALTVDAGVSASVTVRSKDYDFYADAESFSVSCSAASGAQCLVMLVRGTFAVVPTASNEILYIAQTEASGGTAEFEVFPKLDSIVANDEILTLFVVTDSGVMTKTELLYATGVTYTPGDVNGDSETDEQDAIKILRAVVELETLTPLEKLAADVNLDGTVTSLDAQLILQMK